ncbi:PA2779 family protein [Dechloromonas sp. A34]|uniref:PA2779 family protein n=1 Tax=Dechloromonas sp. A34 TaxID=447588 RepID=UPI00224881C3|nr:PA2779 family protein [Dechloromonas sp. A34]
MKTLQRLLAILLSLSLVNAMMFQTAYAGMISTEEVARLASVDQAASGHVRLTAALARADVRAEMARLGVDPALAVERVAALTDEEAANLADRIDSAPAGADGGGIIGALVLIFLVLLFTDIMGWTKIFPFTRSIR